MLANALFNLAHVHCASSACWQNHSPVRYLCAVQAVCAGRITVMFGTYVVCRPCVLVESLSCLVHMSCAGRVCWQNHCQVWCTCAVQAVCAGRITEQFGTYVVCRPCVLAESLSCLVHMSCAGRVCWQNHCHVWYICRVQAVCAGRITVMFGAYVVCRLYVLVESLNSLVHMHCTGCTCW